MILVPCASKRLSLIIVKIVYMTNNSSQEKRRVYAFYFLVAFLFILELLRKYLLPSLHPLLLLRSERLPWTLE
jgi:hypothetical protein